MWKISRKRIKSRGLKINPRRRSDIRGGRHAGTKKKKVRKEEKGEKRERKRIFMEWKSVGESEYKREGSRSHPENANAPYEMEGQWGGIEIRYRGFSIARLFQGNQTTLGFREKP